MSSSSCFLTSVISEICCSLVQACSQSYLSFHTVNQILVRHLAFDKLEKEFVRKSFPKSKVAGRAFKRWQGSHYTASKVLLNGRLLAGVRSFRKEPGRGGQWAHQHEESICDVRKGTMLDGDNGHDHGGGAVGGSDRAMLLCYFLLWWPWTSFVGDLHGLSICAQKLNNETV